MAIFFYIFNIRSVQIRHFPNTYNANLGPPSKKNHAPGEKEELFRNSGFTKNPGILILYYFHFESITKIVGRGPAEVKPVTVRRWFSEHGRRKGMKKDFKFC